MRKGISVVILFIGLAFCMQSCQHEPQITDVVMLTAQRYTLLADDTSQDIIYASIPWQGQGDTVVFTAIHGSFVGGTAVSGQGNMISQFANINNYMRGKYTAQVTYIVPLMWGGGYDTITAYIQNGVPLFIDAMRITLTPSTGVDSIALSSTASSVSVSSGTIATVTGVLFNGFGNKVSAGTPVSFQLLDSHNNNIAISCFFPGTALSDQNSNVTTTFNPAALVNDTGLYTIKAYVVGGSDMGRIPIYVN